MHPTLARIAPGMIVLLLAARPGVVSAQENVDPVGNVIENLENIEESIEVKRADIKEPKHTNLQFLRDNRVFLRAQLDRLRLQVTRESSDGAQILDERYLHLKEMSAQIAAACDTVRSGRELAERRDLMQSVTELGAMESELSLMETLLADQQHRLLYLEKDFLGHQESALVIIVRGLSGGNAPAAIEVAEDGEVVRVELTPEQRTSLQQGGIAQIYHEFVEPREHVLSVSFAGDAWAGTGPQSVRVEAARDRLTFLELNLAQLDRNRESLGLLTSVWYR